MEYKNENLNKKSKLLYVYLSVLFLVVGFILGIYIGFNSTIDAKIVREANEMVGHENGKDAFTDQNASFKDKPINFQLYWDVWDAVKSNFVDREKITDQELFYGSLKGIVDSIGDPYSMYFDPDQAKRFEEDLAGSFEGIGTEIGIKDGILTVIAPLPGTPAEKAGLKAGDKIFFIDKTDTAGMPVDEAVRLIRGQKGTEVVLTVGRDGMTTLMEIKIIRDTIKLESVKWEKIEDESGKIFYYINIISFNEDTKRELDKAIAELVPQKPDGLIIDLRNNPGGYLDVAIQTASLWIEEGVVVSEEYSDRQKNDHWAIGPALFKDFKTVVLVNQGSASASEILAGALQDNNLAVVVGKTTFGKGSVQSLLEFEDDSAAKITVAKWITPKGRQIDELGIAPDIDVDFTLEDLQNSRDPQKEKALQVIKMTEEELSMEKTESQKRLAEQTQNSQNSDN